MSKNPFLLTKSDILDAFNSIVNSDELEAIQNIKSSFNVCILFCLSVSDLYNFTAFDFISSVFLLIAYFHLMF